MKLALLLSLLLFPVAVVAEDWPGWLGPKRDGTSSETVAPWTGELKQLWKLEVGAGHSSAIVSKGKVFLHQQVGKEDKEEVLCIDAKTGKIDWRKDYTRVPYSNQFGSGPRATPCVADGKLYTMGVTGVAACWDVADGKEIWKVDLLTTFSAKVLFFGMSSSPLVADGKVLLMPGNTNDASMVALDAATGKTVWKQGKDPASYAAPVLLKQGDKSLVVFLNGAGVVALNLKDGNEAWRIPFKDLLNESSTTPIIMGDQMFASSVTVGGIGISLGTVDGNPAATKKWSSPKLNCYFGTPVVIGDSLYLVTGKLAMSPEADLHCVDPKTGTIRWAKPKVGKYHATLLKTADKLLMLEENGTLVLIDPSNEAYKELARTKICRTTWAHPALADGVLYVRDDKHLLAVSVKP